MKPLIAALLLAAPHAASASGVPAGGPYPQRPVGAYAIDARGAIERAIGAPLPADAARELENRIRDAEDALSEPKFRDAASEDAYTFMACGHGSLGVSAVGAARVGAGGLACYDWRASKIYLIGAGNVNILKLNAGGGWSAGVGLAVVSHEREKSLEGTYNCGTASGAFGWLGLRGMLCSHFQEGLRQKLIFVGWQGGAELQGGLSPIYVTKF
ncbi:MAG: hypothetical protein HY078_02325 [Elusimicrobia bacterium]|nr:hypothetical protein [Elusimicrobiota bacterium]